MPSRLFGLASRAARRATPETHILTRETEKQRQWREDERRQRDVQKWAQSMNSDPHAVNGLAMMLARMGGSGRFLGRMLLGGQRLTGRALEAGSRLVHLLTGKPDSLANVDIRRELEEIEHLASGEPDIIPPTRGGDLIGGRGGSPPRPMEVGTSPEDERPEWSELYQTPNSSNVWSFQYNYRTRTMYVRYKAPSLNAGSISRAGGSHGRLASVRGKLGRTVTGKTDDPGALYAYFGVPAEVFSKMVSAIETSAGKAVWDELRVRGTVWGHQYRYSLVDAATVQMDQGSALYVPRRATKAGFRTRAVTAGGAGRRAFALSSLPEQLRPSRGVPNRGRGQGPNRGRR